LGYNLAAVPEEWQAVSAVMNSAEITTARVFLRIFIVKKVTLSTENARV